MIEIYEGTRRIRYRYPDQNFRIGVLFPFSSAHIADSESKWRYRPIRKRPTLMPGEYMYVIFPSYVLDISAFPYYFNLAPLTSSDGLSGQFQ